MESRTVVEARNIFGGGGEINRGGRGKVDDVDLASEFGESDGHFETETAVAAGDLEG